MNILERALEAQKIISVMKKELKKEGKVSIKYQAKCDTCIEAFKKEAIKESNSNEFKINVDSNILGLKFIKNTEKLSDWTLANKGRLIKLIVLKLSFINSNLDMYNSAFVTSYENVFEETFIINKSQEEFNVIYFNKMDNKDIYKKIFEVLGLEQNDVTKKSEKKYKKMINSKSSIQDEVFIKWKNSRIIPKTAFEEFNDAFNFIKEISEKILAFKINKSLHVEKQDLKDKLNIACNTFDKATENCLKELGISNDFFEKDTLTQYSLIDPTDNYGYYNSVKTMHIKSLYKYYLVCIYYTIYFDETNYFDSLLFSDLDTISISVEMKDDITAVSVINDKVGSDNIINIPKMYNVDIHDIEKYLSHRIVDFDDEIKISDREKDKIEKEVVDSLYRNVDNNCTEGYEENITDGTDNTVESTIPTEKYMHRIIVTNKNIYDVYLHDESAPLDALFKDDEKILFILYRDDEKEMVFISNINVSKKYEIKCGILSVETDDSIYEISIPLSEQFSYTEKDVIDMVVKILGVPEFTINNIKFDRYDELEQPGKIISSSAMLESPVNNNSNNIITYKIGIAGKEFEISSNTELDLSNINMSDIFIKIGNDILCKKELLEYIIKL